MSWAEELEEKIIDRLNGGDGTGRTAVSDAIRAALEKAAQEVADFRSCEESCHCFDSGCEENDKIVESIRALMEKP